MAPVCWACVLHRAEGAVHAWKKFGLVWKQCGPAHRGATAEIRVCDQVPAVTCSALDTAVQ
jgi:hypothetical protein